MERSTWQGMDVFDSQKEIESFWRSHEWDGKHIFPLLNFQMRPEVMANALSTVLLRS